MSVPPDEPDHLRSPWGIFLIFLRLGLTSFGGPVAHLGYFRHEFVVRRQWLSERGYADLVALCQFLPGPASSQVGMAIGLLRSGHGGALAAWLGFTLPSALLMIGLALGLGRYGGPFLWRLRGAAQTVGLDPGCGHRHGGRCWAAAVQACARRDA